MIIYFPARWNHIENLDDFFARVYHYHQRGGFTCMVVEDILQLM
jgi:autophagy-related protein 9